MPHSGGIGLNEYTQHLSLIDYLCVSGKKSLLERITAFSEAITQPAQVKNGYFITPLQAGYSVEYKTEAITRYSFPDGEFWKSSEGLKIIGS